MTEKRFCIGNIAKQSGSFGDNQVYIIKIRNSLLYNHFKCREYAKELVMGASVMATVLRQRPMLCIQYVGQVGFFMALIWFVSEFARMLIPVWVYVLEAVCNTFVLLGVFTAEKHSFFYTSMTIRTDGMYNSAQALEYHCQSHHISKSA
ncbi:MAG: hypothetical protein ACI4EF_12410 [Coprococcus sp.]